MTKTLLQFLTNFGHSMCLFALVTADLTLSGDTIVGLSLDDNPRSPTAPPVRDCLVYLIISLTS